jgi:hypothetical protein
LLHGAAEDDATDALLIELVASKRSGSSPARILRRFQEALMPVVTHQTLFWPTPSTWAELLSTWLVQSFISEDDNVYGADTEQWTLLGWLYWMKPAERTWFW